MISSLLAAVTVTTPLSKLDLAKVDQGWGLPRVAKSVSGKELKIGSKAYQDGLGVHAPFELIIDLKKKGAAFRAEVGLDSSADGPGTVVFHLIGDGRELWKSPLMKKGEPAALCEVDLKGVKTLLLKVTDGGDGMSADHADWGNALIDHLGDPPATLDVLPERKGSINSGKRWFDTKGALIQAHGGGVIKHKGRFYWFGEERTEGYFNKTGVAAYSSSDLMNWKPEGIAMPSASFPAMFRDQGVCERPKVIYNKKTGQFVMWSHLDANGYRVSQAGIAVSEKITGPYRHVKNYQPIPGQTYRDMNLFVDDDGAAYAFYSSENNATTYILRLTDDYLGHLEPAVEGKTWAKAFIQGWREAPAPFKHDGKYYVITSGCTGWDPNEAQIAVADHPLGPWRVLGNPMRGHRADKTFGGQSTCVFPSGRKGEFVFMADRWNRDNLADSRYIWLPFKISDPERIEIHWNESWKLGPVSVR